MKHFLITLLIIPCFCFGQITFQKIIGTDSLEFFSSSSVIQTTDGGYAFTGTSEGVGVGFGDVVLFKTDSFGDIMWSKAYGGTDYEYGNSLEQTTDGGFIIAGETWSFGQGFAEIYIIKTDAIGDTLWTRVFGGNNYDKAYSVRQTTDGGYIVAGYTWSISPYLSAFLIKIDPNGNLQWSQTYGNNYSTNFNDVEQTTDGGYIATGHYSKIGLEDGLFVVRTNSTGDTLWTRVYGFTNLYEQGGYAIDLTMDGGFIAAGKGFGGVFLVRLDSVGDTLWTRTYDGFNYDVGYDTHQTSDGGFIVAGTMTDIVGNDYQALLFKVDAAGDLLWARAFGGDSLEEAFAVSPTTDGGYIIAGTVFGFGNGNSDFVLLKTDGNGQIGNPETCNQFDVTLSVGYTSETILSGAINISGVIVSNTTTVVSTFNMPDSVMCDSCILPFANFGTTNSMLTVNFTDSTNGATGWYWDFGDSNNDTVQNPMHTYANNGTYWACLYVSNACGMDTFCDSITVSDVGIDDYSKQNFTIYPNPTTGTFTVQGPSLHGRVNNATGIQVYDLFGRLVLRTKEQQVNMSSYPAGIYFVRVGEAVRKVVLH